MELKFTVFVILIAVIGVVRSLSNSELRRFGEELFSADESNFFPELKLNLGRKIPRGDEGVDYAPSPLFDRFDAAKKLNVTSFQALVKFYDNYIVDVRQNEDHTGVEEREQVHFINSIMQTQPMKKLYNFLVEKGVIPSGVGAFKIELKRIWFDFYGRHRNNNGSSGFEHVFLGEIKRGKVSGLHNWLYFYTLERRGEVNYLGYKKYQELHSGTKKAGVLKFSFTWLKNSLKPVGSMFVGTSPQMEMAVYTLCSLARPGGTCTLQIGGKRIRVLTHQYRDSNLIGSAYIDF